MNLLRGQEQSPNKVAGDSGTSRTYTCKLALGNNGKQLNLAT